MEAKINDIIRQNTVFFWIVAITALILLVPFVAMQFDLGVNWTTFDFCVAGALIFGLSTLYIIAVRRLRKRRLLIGMTFSILFLYLWAELAVGIFTTWGS